MIIFYEKALYFPSKCTINQKLGTTQMQKHELSCLLDDFYMNAFADCFEIFTTDAVGHKLHRCTSWKKSANSTIFQSIFHIRLYFS